MELILIYVKELKNQFIQKITKDLQNKEDSNLNSIMFTLFLRNIMSNRHLKNIMSNRHLKRLKFNPLLSIQMKYQLNRFPKMITILILNRVTIRTLLTPLLMIILILILIINNPLSLILNLTINLHRLMFRQLPNIITLKITLNLRRLTFNLLL